MNTLFNTDLNDTSVLKVPQDTKTVDITPVYFGNKKKNIIYPLLLLYQKSVDEIYPSILVYCFTIGLLELEEEGVKLNLCLIDTPGFGDRLNRKEEYVFF